MLLILLSGLLIGSYFTCSVMNIIKKDEPNELTPYNRLIDETAYITSITRTQVLDEFFNNEVQVEVFRRIAKKQVEQIKLNSTQGVPIWNEYSKYE
jgi:hypothetical protein